MNNRYAPELLEKAKGAASAAELTKLAAENGVKLAESQAGEYLAALHKSGEIADDELDNVAGGRMRRRRRKQ